MVAKEQSADLIADIDANIGANMKAQRERMGLSQADVAELAKKAGVRGIHQTTIARIEKGERALRAAEAVALSRILDISLEYLAEGGTAARARGMQRELYEMNSQLTGLLHQITQRRIEVARFLDEIAPTGEDGVELFDFIGQQLKTNVEPRILDSLDEGLLNSDPEDCLSWVYVGFTYRRKKMLEEGGNLPEPGYREASIYEAMETYRDDDGEHQAEA